MIKLLAKFFAALGAGLRATADLAYAREILAEADRTERR